MPSGVRLACDVGAVRIGVARCDPMGILAVPLPAIAAGDRDVDEVLAVIAEWAPTVVYVGLPLRLAGDEGPAAVSARAWAHRLAERTAVPVRLIDERLSTVQAQRALHDAGRTTRSSRSVIDSASAVAVLQSVLEGAARAGGDVGEPVPGGAQTKGRRS